MTEKKESTKPRFIQVLPEGEDLFEGQSHKRIADSLFSLIKEKAIPNNVIGLEGKWGVGKSNIIKILEKKFVKAEADYVFYTYDTWAHQEDLTRRTFLDGLIADLKFKKKFKKYYDADDLTKKVLSRVTKTKIDKQPKIKLFYLFLLIGAFLFTLGNSLYNDFFMEWDMIKDYEAPLLKKFLGRYFIPSIFVVLAIIDFVIEWVSLNHKNSTKHLGVREKLKRLLYVFSGTDVESEEFMETVDEEPSIKNFKEYFSEIQKNVTAEGLIIVFDNMDRLISKKKVMSIWSSIHTFFAEEDLKNAWVIVPYDKEHLSSYFETNGNGQAVDTLNNFIGKTFTTAFRVVPPVLSDWKRFFKEKFKYAFGEELNDEHGENISSLYELVHLSRLRKPRDIIGFINEMVALRLQHGQMVEIEYVALFCLRKSQILENPLTEISAKHFLKEEKHLFQDEREIEQSMAVLVYNVDKDKCSEVLLKNGIQDGLRGFDSNTWDAIKNHTEFAFYFNDAMLNSGLGNFNPEHITKILDYLTDTIPNARLTTYWEKFANSLDKRVKEDFLGVKNWHKLTMENTGKKTTKKFADKLVETAKNELGKDSGSEQYYRVVYDVIAFLKKRKVKPSIPKVLFTPVQMLEFVNNYHAQFTKETCDFLEMNISTDPKELDTFLVNHKNGMVEQAAVYIEGISYLRRIDSKYDFKTLRSKASSILETISYTDGSDKILELIKVNQALTLKNKTITLIPEGVGNNYLNSYYQNDKELDIEIFANQIAHLAKGDARNAEFRLLLDTTDSDASLAPTIQYYVRYGGLLKIYIENKRVYPLLSHIIRNITDNNFGFTQSLDVTWAFSNLNAICEQLFSGEYIVFLRKLDEWATHFEKSITTASIFEVMNVANLEIVIEYWDSELKCIQHLAEKLEQKFLGLNKSEWETVLKEDKIPFKVLAALVEKERLNTKITKGNAFMDAYDDVMKEYANRTISISEDTLFWKSLLFKDLLDKRQLSRIFNGILDTLMFIPDVNSDEISFFSEGLFNHASNRLKKNKSDDFIRKIILPLKESVVQFDYVFENFSKEIVDIINKCPGEYNSNLAEVLSRMKEITSSSRDEIDFVFQNTPLVFVIAKDEDKDTGSEDTTSTNDTVG